MDGYTLVDGGVLAVVLLSAVLAYSRGLVRELLSIAGWIIAAVAAFTFASAVEPLMREVPVLKDLLGTNCELGILAGFAAVFVVALILVSVFTPMLSGAVHNSVIGPVDQGLGFLFGIGRGLLLVIVALTIYDQLMGAEGGMAVVDESRSRELLSGLQQQARDFLPDNGAQWLAERFGQLTSACQV